MPNWVDIDIYVEGSSKDPQLKAMYEEWAALIGSENSNLSLKYIGYPKERQQCIDEFPKLPKAQQERWMICERDIEAAASSWWYNEYNGYNWCCENWGSKWGLELREIKDEYKDFGYFTFRAESPWSAPVATFEAIAKAHPTFTIKFTYYEQGMQFHGYYRYENGMLESHDEAKYFGDRGG